MQDKFENLTDVPCKNWPDDYAHENGNYQNRCVYCGGLFFGFKQRVVCRLCDRLDKDQIKYLIELEDGRRASGAN